METLKKSMHSSASQQSYKPQKKIDTKSRK